jgi:hypothetical protein
MNVSNRARLYYGFSFQVQGSFCLLSRFRERIFQGVEVGGRGVTVDVNVIVEEIDSVEVNVREGTIVNTEVNAAVAVITSVLVNSGWTV